MPELPVDQGLESYVDVVVDAIGDRSVVLVGHSMAGAVISLVAEAIPEKIERLVYLAAFALRDGESINDLASQSEASALRDNMSFADGLVTVNVDSIPGAFYHDCDPEDIEAATAKLRAQNPAAFGTPVSLTEDRFGSVPAQYIECIEDQAIPISLQRQMARNIGCTLVNSLQTSHSPFFSAPAALAALIAMVGIKDARA